MANNVEELGGAQRVVHVLAQGFGERGHDVTVVGVLPHPAPYRYQAQPAYRTITLLDRPYPKDPESMRALEHAATDALQQVLDETEPGIVITAQLWAMEHLARCRLGDWRVIGQYHSSFEAASAGRDLSRAQAVYRDVDAFALLCAEDAAAFASMGFTNAVTMPNPLAYWPAEPSDTRDHVVTYLGRFSAEKGPRFLIDAWRLIAPAHPDWRLELIGSGPIEQQLRDSVAGEDARIEIREPTAEPMQVLMRSGVVALPSLTEGFPLVLAEAMACGAACVASDCSAGVRALVTDGVTGLIARRGDDAHLAGQLERLIDSPETRTRLGAAARESVEYLRQPAILDRWDALFADVLR